MWALGICILIRQKLLSLALSRLILGSSLIIVYLSVCKKLFSIYFFFKTTKNALNITAIVIKSKILNMHSLKFFPCVCCKCHVI